MTFAFGAIASALQRAEGGGGGAGALEGLLPCWHSCSLAPASIVLLCQACTIHDAFNLLKPSFG